MRLAVGTTDDRSRRQPAATMPTIRKSRRHKAAREWWERLMNGTRSVGLPWVAILGFIRIATNPKILDNPLDVGSACTRVRAWLSRPQTVVIHPGDRHADILFALLEAAGSAGNLTTGRTPCCLGDRAPGRTTLDRRRHGAVSGSKVEEPSRMTADGRIGSAAHSNPPAGSLHRHICRPPERLSILPKSAFAAEPKRNASPSIRRSNRPICKSGES